MAEHSTPRCSIGKTLPIPEFPDVTPRNFYVRLSLRVQAGPEHQKHLMFVNCIEIHESDVGMHIERMVACLQGNNVVLRHPVPSLEREVERETREPAPV